MKIKVDSLSFAKDLRKSKVDAFRVWDLKFKLNPDSLTKCKDDSEILKCLKYVIKENENFILYDELSELVDSSCIIGNNFWSEEEFLKACMFEYRNYFDFSDCKLLYA